jgi:hypothetical protein
MASSLGVWRQRISVLLSRLRATADALREIAHFLIEGAMRLMAVYVLIVLVIEAIAVRIGLYLDTWAPTFTVPMALGLFFAVLALGWPLAVYITERWLTPKSG